MADFSWILFLSFNIMLLLGVTMNLTPSNNMMLKLSKSIQEKKNTKKPFKW